MKKPKKTLTDQDIAANDAILIAKNCGLTAFKKTLLEARV